MRASSKKKQVQNKCHKKLCKNLNTLKVLVETSKLPLIVEAYKDIIKQMYVDFHGKLTAAGRNFDAGNFAGTREHLDSINENLLLHADAYEDRRAD